MEENNIEGGVAPLKARQSSRGGKRAGKAHTPKINWGKKKEAVDDKPAGEDLVDETLKKDAPPPIEVTDYSSFSKSDMSSERDKLRSAGTFDPEGGDPASVAVQNKINELYGVSKRY